MMVQSLGRNITTGSAEGGGSNERAAEISALVPKGRHFYSCLHWRCRIYRMAIVVPCFLVTAAGQAQRSDLPRQICI